MIDANRTMISAWPGGSNARPRTALDSGTNLWVSAMATIPIGRLTQNTDRQPIPLTSRPPSTGPAAMVTPIADPHTPTALARSRRSVNTLTMIDSATGLSIEPPTACRPRKAISHPALGARPQRRELRENSDSPSWKIRLRPKRSAIEPDSTSRQAMTRE
jgi:hypothetical protein